MKYQEAKSIIILETSAFLEGAGFRPNDKSSGLVFIRKDDKAQDFISFSMSDYGFKHNIYRPIGSRRFNKVEDILFEVLHLPDEDKDTSTIYPLGEYDGKMDDVLPGPLDYVQTEDDVRKVVSILKPYIEKYILPFFTKYPTLKEVDAKIQQTPIVDLHKFIGQEVIGRRMVIMKLACNPGYEEYVKMILDYFVGEAKKGNVEAKADLEKYTRLKEYLANN